MTARYEKKNKMTNSAVLRSKEMKYTVNRVNGRPGVHKSRREKREESDLDKRVREEQVRWRSGGLRSDK